MLNSPPTGFRLDVTLTLALAALLATAGCIRLPANDASGANAANADQKKKAPVVIWDGDKHGGNAKEWANCNMKASCESSGGASMNRTWKATIEPIASRRPIAPADASTAT